MTSLQRIIKYCAVAFAIFLIVTIIGGICGAIGMLSGFFGGWVSGENAAGEMRTYAVSGSVENLDLEIGAAALDIVTGDRFSLESNHKYLSVKEENHTLKISEEKMTWLLRETCDMTPGGIIKKLNLRRPIYADTAARGHFGVEGRPWEETDLAEKLKELAGI